MEKVEKFKCPVCGRYELETYEECPYCHWELDGLEIGIDEELVIGGPMGNMSIADAKRLLEEGKDVYGDPLLEE